MRVGEHCVQFPELQLSAVTASTAVVCLGWLMKPESPTATHMAQAAVATSEQLIPLQQGVWVLAADGSESDKGRHGCLTGSFGLISIDGTS